MNAPNNEALVRIGKAFLDEGEVIEANNYIRRALNIDPSNPNAYYVKGLIAIDFYRRTEDIKHLKIARESFNRALEIHPGHLVSYLERAKVKEQFGHTESAKKDYRTILELSDESEDIRALSQQRLCKLLGN